MSNATTLAVTRHHLAPDLKSAGANFPDVEQQGVTPQRLRGWLESLVKLAPKVEYPAVPELRIVGPRGRFLVQAKGGQVRLTSWSTNEGGSDLTPDRILSLVLGTGQEETAAFAVDITAAVKPRAHWTKLALLAVVVLATNGVTAWMLMKPAPRLPLSLLPEYTVVGDEPAQRIFRDYAGEYEMGGAEGDRALTIRPDGTLRWVTFGPNRAIAEETALTAQAAQSRGQPVMIAENLGLIERKDPITITYFNDRYARKTK
jgi:hypothetical protein